MLFRLWTSDPGSLVDNGPPESLTRLKLAHERSLFSSISGQEWKERSVKRGVVRGEWEGESGRTEVGREEWVEESGKRGVGRGNRK